MIIKQLIKTVGNTLSSVVKDKYSRLAMHFVWHYLEGSQNNMTLPKDAVLYLRSNLLSTIQYRLDVPSYRTLVACSPSTETDYDPYTIPNWLGMQGVVGAYEFKIHGIKNNHLLISCWDTWDFNNTVLDLSADVKSEKLAKVIQTMARKKGVEVSVTGSVIHTTEKSLSILNEKHAFTTKWKDVIHLDSFTKEHQEKLKSITNWKYLVNERDVKELALDNAIEDLGGFFYDDDTTFTLYDFEVEIPKTWEMVNKLRSSEEPDTEEELIQIINS